MSLRKLTSEIRLTFKNSFPYLTKNTTRLCYKHKSDNSFFFFEIITVYSGSHEYNTWTNSCSAAGDKYSYAV
jgi:hypothetical protein